jgi:hypothetical protein
MGTDKERFRKTLEKYAKEGAAQKELGKKSIDKAYRNILSLCLWDHHSAKLRLEPKVFLGEVRSDAVQSIVMAVAGFYKPAALCLRGCIENCSRFFYYADHPVEFRLCGPPTESYMNWVSLKQYLSSHPDVKKAKPTFDVPGGMSTTYSELSRSIHGSPPRKLQLKKYLEEIRFDLSKHARFLKDLSTVTEVSNFLLTIWHDGELIRGMSTENRELVLSSLSMKNRRYLAGIP